MSLFFIFIFFLILLAFSGVAVKLHLVTVIIRPQFEQKIAITGFSNEPVIFYSCYAFVEGKKWEEEENPLIII